MQRPQHDFEPIAILSVESIASRALIESVRMKLYDRLETPQTVAQIAATFDMTDGAAEAFLDVLEERGLLVNSNGMYANSPVASEYLVSESPFYQGGSIELHEKLNDSVVREMTNLLHGGGTRGGHEAPWKPSADYLASLVQYSLRGGLQDTIDFIVALQGFLEMRTMCDIGGNHGRYSMALLDQNPDLTAVVADLPDVVSVASSMCREAGYGERLSFAPCDLRDDSPSPGAYDLVLASHVLYPFSEQLDDVVARIGQALKPGGWFVAQHLDPNNSASRRFRTAMDLTTCLMRNSRHVVYPADLESAMSRAGLGDIKTATSGYHAENAIVAARRALEA
jgi:hypothetical protein